jgi:hypothetical protein
MTLSTRGDGPAGALLLASATTRTRGKGRGELATGGWEVPGGERGVTGGGRAGVPLTVEDPIVTSSDVSTSLSFLSEQRKQQILAGFVSQLLVRNHVLAHMLLIRARVAQVMVAHEYAPRTLSSILQGYSRSASILPCTLRVFSAKAMATADG